MTSISTTATRAAIVTGGSGCIGCQTAERLGGDGIAVGYTGNPAAAKEVAAANESAGGTATAAQADVSDPNIGIYHASKWALEGVP